jgi:hypothetical protein
MMEKYRLGGDKYKKHIGPDFFRDLINYNN